MDTRLTHWKKQIIHACLLGVMSVICFFLLDEGEERYGLSWLFAMRGTVPAPDDVVVIAIDQASALKLGYPTQVSRWPRAAHADLIGRLAEAGASVIVVDLVFSYCKLDADDQRLAAAIKKAGNILLVEGFFPGDLLDGETSADSKMSDHPVISGYVRQEICPIFVDASRAQSPFILPSTMDGRVTHHWHFASVADETTLPLVEIQPVPMLPALAMQVFSLPLYAEFVHIVQQVSPDLAIEVSAVPENVEEMMLLLRRVFFSQPHLYQQLRQYLEGDATLSSRQKQILRALIDLYATDEKRYLNFYGPPRSIRTISYHQILASPENRALLDLQGKAVFIGISAQNQIEQDFVKAGDDYVTPFLGKDGTKVSGVEIAATVFANLLDNSAIRPLPAWVSISLLFILIFVSTLIFCRVSGAAIGILGIILIVCYWAMAYYQFTQFHRWLPLVTPTIWMALCMMVVAITKSHGKIEQYLSIFKATLSEKIEADAEKSHGPIEIIHETANGICMFTDIWRYSAIAEKMDPHDLREMMTRYFAVLKEQILIHDGEVISAQGDEVHAIWRIRSADDYQQKIRACLACLDIGRALERFHQADSTLPLLQTRIGLHYGEMSLCLVKASDSHAINATGDTVNIAKRIESANKVLGTHLLLSASVADQLHNFLLRPLGEYILPGMSREVALLELVSNQSQADDAQRWLCSAFELGLHAYQAQQFHKASCCFQDILRRYPDDGPTLFYLARCNESGLNPSTVIHL